MSLTKYITVIFMLLFITNCSTADENKKEKKVIPDKITMLYVTQPQCPSCDALNKVMNQPEPKKLIENYFQIKKVYLGEKIPDNLIPPNGTPTIYFLGSDDEVLVEPIIGEKTEPELMEFLNDSLYEFKVTYGVDIRELKKENNETKGKDEKVN
jgi:hypothetical protein